MVISIPMSAARYAPSNNLAMVTDLGDRECSSPHESAASSTARNVLFGFGCVGSRLLLAPGQAPCWVQQVSRLPSTWPG